MPKNDENWRTKLTPEQFRICREKGTERPFTGEYYNCHDAGTYHCACCGQELFSSESKYDSGSGWPSFWQPVAAAALETIEDKSMHAARTEIVCSNCGCHLGHVFDDGPAPTGQRYCVNSASLKLSRR